MYNTVPLNAIFAKIGYTKKSLLGLYYNNLTH